MGRLRKANLRTLLRYDRAIKGRPAHEVSPALRDQIRRMISQKVTMMAVGMMIMASLLGAIIVWFHRLLSAG